MSLKQIFSQGRIIGLAGNRNSGKSNNLIYLIQQFREINKKTNIFVYGFKPEVVQYLNKYNVKEIVSLKQLLNKRDCILIIDEMQQLKLNDRRYTDIKNQFSDFVYHNNVYTILSSPSIREFNSVICSIIEGWLLKSIDIDQCVNGSQLKKVIDEYKGQYKLLGCINTPKNKMLLINENENIEFSCDYIEKIDTKKEHIDLFECDVKPKKSQRIVNKKDKKLSKNK